MKKRIICVVLCLFLLMVTLSSCKDAKFIPAQKPFDKKIQSSTLAANSVIADNSNYTLKYDAETASIKLVEKASGLEWFVCPTPSGEGSTDNPFGIVYDTTNDFVRSSIKVNYLMANRSPNNVFSYSGAVAEDAGRIVCKEIKDGDKTIGVTVEYYFDTQEFMVPVDYVLHDDYFSISVDSTKIQENELQITSVDLAPFLCSVENNKIEPIKEENDTDAAEGEASDTEAEKTDAETETEDDEAAAEDAATENDPFDKYLFMPSGSGALIGVDDVSINGFEYNAYIYGEDATNEDFYDAANEIPVRLPVYGYKNGNVGGFAIIDDGAEAAILKTSAGNTVYEFSTIYPSFQLRGYTEHQARNFNSTYLTNIYPENMIEGKFSVRFYPLSGDKANYSSMAKVYQGYLEDECGLKKNSDDKAVNVNLIGGTEITKSMLGVPYTTVLATTTVEDANKIITELLKDIDNMSVKLKGYGKNGVDIGTVGGGFNISGNIGSASQLKKLSTLCKDSKIDLYMDYDLVRFSSGGSGFSFSRDAVMNSGIIRADQYLFDKAVRNVEEAYKYRLLRPIQFNDAVAKSVKATSGWGIAGVSLDTLSSITYSDYADNNTSVKFNAKHGFDDAVTEALKQIKDNNQKFTASGANAFAAVKADLITDVPTASGDGYAFIQDVPFYSMVFKGYIPMTTESVNLAATPEKVILAAVEGGVGLGYTVINKWDNALIDSMYPYFYSSEYSHIKGEIVNTNKALSGYYTSIKGATIASNEIIENGVHCTTFDNGVKAYVNYNRSSVQSPAGEITAQGYLVINAQGEKLAGGAA